MSVDNRIGIGEFNVPFRIRRGADGRDFLGGRQVAAQVVYQHTSVLHDLGIVLPGVPKPAGVRNHRYDGSHQHGQDGNGHHQFY